MPILEGNLPKNYQEFEKDLLRDLVRIFNKDAVKRATGDVFGRIYEYFLMKFSMQGAGHKRAASFLLLRVWYNSSSISSSRRRARFTTPPVYTNYAGGYASVYARA
jgi:hypothetical protein